MRTNFENELKQLHKHLMRMGTAIEESMALTIKAIETKDIKIAHQIIQQDDIVDDLEAEIEKECINLIAKQQPVASDLRIIASVLKIVTDLERIADNCADISEYLIKISSLGNDFDIPKINAMASEVKKMLKDTIDAYISNDTEKAIATAKNDDVVDNYFTEIDQYILEEMKKSSDNIEAGMYYLYIVKYLERMADHCTNVCEWIAYRVTGQKNNLN